MEQHEGQCCNTEDVVEIDTRCFKLTNNEILNSIEEALPELGDTRVYDDHPIIWGGNPDASILVVQLCPDRSELYSAKKLNIHNTFVCAGPGGNEFKYHAKNAGFNIQDDFLYLNLFPYVPIGCSTVDDELIKKYFWILQLVINELQPKMIITLGYKVFRSMFPDSKVNIEIFEHCLNHWKMLSSDDTLVAMLDDPYELIDIEGTRKNNFTKTLRIIHAKTPTLRYRNGQ